MADFSKAACASCWPHSFSSAFKRGESSDIKVSLNSGNANKASRKVLKSRGLAERNATRARIRSISPRARNCSRRPCSLRFSIKVFTACKRSLITVRFCNGRCNHRRSKRPAIGVMVESKTPSKVCSIRPSTRESSSRCRRVAAFIAMLSSDDSSTILDKCGSRCFWVSST